MSKLKLPKFGETRRIYNIYYGVTDVTTKSEDTLTVKMWNVTVDVKFSYDDDGNPIFDYNGKKHSTWKSLLGNIQEHNITESVQL